jgi:uncharacterized protein
MAQPSDPIRRHPERSRTERADLDAVLDDGPHVASLCTVVAGEPWVVPMLYARDGDRIVLHGSTGAGALRHVAAGATVALSVTHLDGWVYAHTMFDSSANYRSAVVRGAVSPLDGDAAAAAFDVLVDRVFPGRRREVPPHTRKQLAATMALELPITAGNWSVKIRSGGPGRPGPDEEVAPDLWTGVLPIHLGYGSPWSADGVPADVPVSPSVEAERRR